MIAPFHYSLFSVKRILHKKADFFNQIVFSSITTSSTEAVPGSLFIPLQGNRDGHDYIADALDHGASGFLYEEGHKILKKLPPEKAALGIQVKDTLQALGHLGAAHRKRFEPFIIGITGSSGKTTVKDMLYSICSSIGKKHVIATEKNYNNEIGVPFTLFRINEDTRIVICEMGMNHKGELSRISKMAAPHAAIITNIGPAHIEFFKSTKKIAHAKSEIMDGMTNSSPVYIPEDILHLDILKEEAEEKKVSLKKYSLEKSEINIIQTHRHGFDLSYQSVDFHWKMPGKKLLQNLSGVFSICSKLDFTAEQITENIKNFKPAGNRLNILNIYYSIIDDCYNANPDSMLSSLEVLEQYAGDKKKYAILGDMKELGEKSKSYHEWLGGEAAAFNLDGLITFGKDAKYILKKFIKKKGKNKADIALHFDGTQENIKLLLQELLKKAPADSVVLIKGSRSLKMEQIAESIRDVIIGFSNSRL